MAQIAKMEFQTEMRSSADKFYDLCRNKTHLMPKICPQDLKDGKLVEGSWNCVGSVMEWTFVAAGNTETVKQAVEAIDDKSKTMTFNVLEGDMMKYYKSFKSTMNITASGEGSLVKWTVEYEKENEGIPDPVQYKDCLVSVGKNIDAYLLNA